MRKSIGSTMLVDSVCTTVLFVIDQEFTLLNYCGVQEGSKWTINATGRYTDIID